MADKIGISGGTRDNMCSWEKAVQNNIILA